ncbi:MAG: hypothetical protein KBG80_06375 [Breznakibacter sp.]|nr:hypothetical protein [Breznakibacter sp.]
MRLIEQNSVGVYHLSILYVNSYRVVVTLMTIPPDKSGGYAHYTPTAYNYDFIDRHLSSNHNFIIINYIVNKRDHILIPEGPPQLRMDDPMVAEQGRSDGSKRMYITLDRGLTSTSRNGCSDGIMLSEYLILHQSPLQ